jgi:hypothetical protein
MPGHRSVTHHHLLSAHGAHHPHTHKLVVRHPAVLVAPPCLSRLRISA